MEPDSRRTHASPWQLAQDIGKLLPMSGQIGRLMRGMAMDPAFRERLMLAVTAVNDCRYCFYGHARQALAAGVSPQEIATLVRGEFDGCPSEELPALLYAQHWAGRGGNADAVAHQRLVEVYGAERADAIELALRVIHVGNMGGNALDHMLFRLSFGRLGRRVCRAKKPLAASRT